MWDQAACYEPLTEKEKLVWANLTDDLWIERERRIKADEEEERERELKADDAEAEFEDRQQQARDAAERERQLKAACPAPPTEEEKLLWARRDEEDRVR